MWKSRCAALQAAIAINTALHDSSAADLARAFYESRLVDSAALHAKWTRGYYRQAWPGASYSFWRDRSATPSDGCERTGLLARLQEVSDQLEARELNHRAGDGRLEKPREKASVVGTLSTARIRLSPDSKFVDTPCVVDDRIRVLKAIAHPNLASPVAFLAETELFPLLHLTPGARDLSHLLALWARSIPAPRAGRIMLWLLQEGILTVDDDDC